ncbi:MAG TPA: YetF domain-containing protein [Anaerolineae bacterium]|nr:YetF domain-containing protein [Anaerolineae bacterium]
MAMLFEIDWQKFFVPSVSLIEIILRGSVIHLLLFSLLRFVLKREAATLSITDLLVVVLIADATQNAMSSEYKSVTEGLLLVLTIVFWSYLLDWLGYRFPAFQRFVHPPPLRLVKDGQMIRQNMRREMITEGELMSQLHQQGLEDVSEIKAAYMEGDGNISIIPFELDPRKNGKKDRWK